MESKIRGKESAKKMILRWKARKKVKKKLLMRKVKRRKKLELMAATKDIHLATIPNTATTNTSMDIVAAVDMIITITITTTTIMKVVVMLIIANGGLLHTVRGPIFYWA